MNANAHEVRADRHRVLIGEPDPLARQAIASGFATTSHFSVIAATADPRDLVELARHYQPEITLIDAAASDFDGLGICRKIAGLGTATRILVLERNPSVEQEVAALLAGASGVVPKSAGIETIIDASQRILNGELPHSDDSMRLLLDRSRSLTTSVVGMRPVKSMLTPREWEVLDLLTAEKSSAEIAAQLHLTPHTVSSHVKNLMRKLEVNSRSAAVESGHRLRSPGND